MLITTSSQDIRNEKIPAGENAFRFMDGRVTRQMAVSGAAPQMMAAFWERHRNFARNRDADNGEGKRQDQVASDKGHNNVPLMADGEETAI